MNSFVSFSSFAFFYPWTKTRTERQRNWKVRDGQTREDENKKYKVEGNVENGNNGRSRTDRSKNDVDERIKMGKCFGCPRIEMGKMEKWIGD